MNAPNTSADEMRATAWTPGPWLGRGGVVYASDEAGHLLADVFGTAAGEVAGNTRLIAAAPDAAEYVRKRAEAGDPEAIKLWEAINGRR